MRFARVFHPNQCVTAVSLLGLLVFSGGCGGVSGESNVAPSSPPPGFSAQEQADAYKNAYGPKGKPKPTRDPSLAKAH